MLPRVEHTVSRTFVATVALAMALSVIPLPEVVRPFPGLIDAPKETLTKLVWPRRSTSPAQPPAPELDTIDLGDEAEAPSGPMVFEALDLTDSAPPPRPRPKDPEARRWEVLLSRVQAPLLDIENPCFDVDCQRSALSPWFAAIERLAHEGAGPVRVVTLGTSLIASDHITDVLRRRLQARWGDAGLGYLFVDRPTRNAGRTVRSGTATEGWIIDKVTDPSPLTTGGMGGVAFTAPAGSKEETSFLAAGTRRLELFVVAQPGGGAVQVLADGVSLGEVETQGTKGAPLFPSLEVPEGVTQLTLRPRRGAVRLDGVVLERAQAGVVLDSLGLPGASATVVLAEDEGLFRAQLAARRPALVILMIGGNDAFDLSLNRYSVEAARQRMEALVDRVKAAAPKAACLLASPPDAGVWRMDQTLVARPQTRVVAGYMSAIARAKGCAWYDMQAAMGGEGAIERWWTAGLMNRDLVHPLGLGGDLMGYQLDEALLAAFRAAKSRAGGRHAPAIARPRAPRHRSTRDRLPFGVVTPAGHPRRRGRDGGPHAAAPGAAPRARRDGGTPSAGAGTGAPGARPHTRKDGGTATGGSAPNGADTPPHARRDGGTQNAAVVTGEPGARQRTRKDGGTATGGSATNGADARSDGGTQSAGLVAGEPGAPPRARRDGGTQKDSSGSGELRARRAEGGSEEVKRPTSRGETTGEATEPDPAGEPAAARRLRDGGVRAARKPLAATAEAALAVVDLAEDAGTGGPLECPPLAPDGGVVLDAGIAAPRYLVREEALHRFFGHLRTLEHDGVGRVAVMQLGASHTAAQIFTDEARLLLSSRFGAAGRGFIGAGKSSPRLEHAGVHRALFGPWKITDALKQRATGHVWGLTGVRTEAAPGASLTMTFDEPFGSADDIGRIQVYYLEEPGGLPPEVIIDGVLVPVPIEPAVRSAVRVLEFGAPGHRHVISLSNPGPGPLSIFGVSHELMKPGIVYDALGLPGSTANTLASYDQAALMHQVAARQPDLLVLFYGTNESALPPAGVEEMRRSYPLLFATLRQAAPQADCLIVAPTDRMHWRRAQKGWRPADSIDEVIDSMRTIADEQGCAFWETRVAMGGPGAIDRWRKQKLAHSDHVHLTPEGYRRLAGWLVDDLLTAYERWKVSQ